MTRLHSPEAGGNSALPVPTTLPECGTIAEWPLNGRECVRISLDQFKGMPLINIRKWFRAEDESIRPTKDGIALRVRHLPQLADALGDALAVARERGLLVGDGADK